MKKFVFSLLLVASMALFAGCGEQLLLDVIGEYGGEEAKEIFEEAIEQNQKDIEEFDRQWDETKDELRDAAKQEAKAEIDKNYTGENPDDAKDMADAGVDIGFGILDALMDMATGSDWDYPVENPICTWRDFEEETMSWGEWEFASSDGRTHHLGMDLASDSGNTDIYAAADGVVVYSSAGTADEKKSNGYRVVIEHELDDQTIYSFYGHMAAYTDLPATGTQVKCGDRIGTLGSTGFSSGPHVHFAVYKEKTFDPPGRSQKFSGNVRKHNNITFYNPKYIIENGKLPEE